MTLDTLISISILMSIIGIALDLVNGRGASMVIVAAIVFLALSQRNLYIDQLEDFCYTNPDYPKCYKVEEWRNKFTEDKSNG